MTRSTKAQFETERQRRRIADDSVFGVWTDTQKSIRVRISPVRNSIRIRIVEVMDRSVIDAIAFFSGLHFAPKRLKWTNFDLVTNLVKHHHMNKYVFGEVHMPRAPRRTSASLIIQDKLQVQLNFHDVTTALAEVCTGSLVLCKDSNWHNREKKVA